MIAPAPDPANAALVAFLRDPRSRLSAMAHMVVWINPGAPKKGMIVGPGAVAGTFATLHPDDGAPMEPGGTFLEERRAAVGTRADRKARKREGGKT